MHLFTCPTFSCPPSETVRNQIAYAMRFNMVSDIKIVQEHYAKRSSFMFSVIINMHKKVVNYPLDALDVPRVVTSLLLRTNKP